MIDPVGLEPSDSVAASLRVAPTVPFVGFGVVTSVGAAFGTTTAPAARARSWLPRFPRLQVFSRV